MSTVLENPVNQAIAEFQQAQRKVKSDLTAQSEAFKPPEPPLNTIGDVVWYEHKDRHTRRNPIAVTVRQINGRTIHCEEILNTRGGVDTFKQHVLHIADPEVELTERAHGRHRGLWDFSVQYKLRLAQEVEWEAKLEKIRETIAAQADVIRSLRGRMDSNFPLKRTEQLREIKEQQQAELQS